MTLNNGQSNIAPIHFFLSFKRNASLLVGSSALMRLHRILSLEVVFQRAIGNDRFNDTRILSEPVSGASCETEDLQAALGL